MLDYRKSLLVQLSVETIAHIKHKLKMNLLSALNKRVSDAPYEYLVLDWLHFEVSPTQDHGTYQLDLSIQAPRPCLEQMYSHRV